MSRRPLAGAGSRRLAPALSLALGLALPALAADREAALREGERRFRARDFAGAMAVYREAWRQDPGDTVLAYDLGAAAHRAGRLPEAVLWYRRAESGGDPWVEDNLALARRALGTPEAPPAAAAGPWRQAGTGLAAAGILLAWVLPALLARGRTRPWTAGALAAAALALFAAGLALERRAPRPGVLLEPCGGHPAGGEVWVRPEGWGGAAWRVVGAAAEVCPDRAVAPVEE